MQLAQRLVKKGLISSADLPRIAEAQASLPGKGLHEIIIERGFAKEEDVLVALAEEFGMDIVDLASVHVEKETLEAMPSKAKSDLTPARTSEA